MSIIKVLSPVVKKEVFCLTRVSQAFKLENILRPAFHGLASGESWSVAKPLFSLGKEKALLSSRIPGQEL